MSKLSFRARALDASKPLPVFRCEDLPDLHEYASINRAVPQMPTGMEKEEESVCFFNRENMCFAVFFTSISSQASLFFLCASFHKMAADFLRRNATEFCCKWSASGAVAGVVLPRGHIVPL